MPGGVSVDPIDNPQMLADLAKKSGGQLAYARINQLTYKQKLKLLDQVRQEVRAKCGYKIKDEIKLLAMDTTSSPNDIVVHHFRNGGKPNTCTLPWAQVLNMIMDFKPGEKPAFGSYGVKEIMDATGAKVVGILDGADEPYGGKVSPEKQANVIKTPFEYVIAQKFPEGILIDQMGVIQYHNFMASLGTYVAVDAGIPGMDSVVVHSVLPVTMGLKGPELYGVGYHHGGAESSVTISAETLRALIINSGGETPAQPTPDKYSSGMKWQPCLECKQTIPGAHLETCEARAVITGITMIGQTLLSDVQKITTQSGAGLSKTLDAINEANVSLALGFAQFGRDFMGYGKAQQLDKFLNDALSEVVGLMAEKGFCPDCHELEGMHKAGCPNMLPGTPEDVDADLLEDGDDEEDQSGETSDVCDCGPMQTCKVCSGAFNQAAEAILGTVQAEEEKIFYGVEPFAPKLVADAMGEKVPKTTQNFCSHETVNVSAGKAVCVSCKEDVSDQHFGGKVGWFKNDDGTWALCKHHFTTNFIDGTTKCHECGKDMTAETPKLTKKNSCVSCKGLGYTLTISKGQIKSKQLCLSCMVEPVKFGSGDDGDVVLAGNTILDQAEEAKYPSVVPGDVVHKIKTNYLIQKGDLIFVDENGYAKPTPQEGPETGKSVHIVGVATSGSVDGLVDVKMFAKPEKVDKVAYFESSGTITSGKLDYAIQDSKGGDTIFYGPDKKEILRLTSQGTIKVSGNVLVGDNAITQQWAEHFWRVVEQFNPVNKKYAESQMNLTNMTRERDMFRKFYVKLVADAEEKKKWLGSVEQGREAAAKERFKRVAMQLKLDREKQENET